MVYFYRYRNHYSFYKRLGSSMKNVRFLIVVLLFFLVACNGGKIEENMSEPLPDFEFTTQDHEKLSLQDLEGQWWLTSFMYTNCQTICPVMTQNMVDLQHALKENDVTIQMVSFSVDPEYDTPDVLKEYTQQYPIDLDDWVFLTGYDFETIRDLSEQSFKMSLQQASAGTGNDQIVHATSFFLVNPEGTIVKKYDGVGKEGLQEAIEDVK